MAASLEIRMRLSDESRDMISEKGSTVSSIEGDLQLRIGGTYLGQEPDTTDAPWFRDVLLDEFLLSMVQVATTLQSSEGPIEVELPGLIFRLRIHRTKDSVCLAAWMTAPMWQEIPRHVPIEPGCLPYDEFVGEILSAARNIFKDIELINPRALRAAIATHLRNAVHDLENGRGRPQG